MSDKNRTFKKFDTYADYTTLVRLATDAKVYPREANAGEQQGEDVVLTFCDNSRIENTVEMWIDARLHPFHNELGKKMRKGDVVQIRGKLRWRLGNDGSLRGKIYDAKLATYAGFDRATDGDVAAGLGLGGLGKDPVPPSFE